MSEQRHWIFLRGLARGRGHWGDFPQRFQQKFPQDHIEMIDLPGNGESRRELSPLNLAEYVDIIRSRSQTLREGKKIYILAVSLGAMIATQWMEMYPQEVRKAFLVCTSAGNMSRFYQRLQPHNYLKILSLAVSYNGNKYEEKVLEIIANNRERAQALLPQFSRYSSRYPVSRKNFVRQILAASRSRFPTQKPGDVVVIGSYGDRMVEPICTLKIAKTWGVNPLMHPTAGHDLPIDDPDWLLEKLV